ncbi:MAG TPA: hypothetical protein VK272_07760 [Solirubrobacteraceae bacterium]|nr:hypothetical protein [Solirubrobacteraceae bacterium]
MLQRIAPARINSVRACYVMLEIDAARPDARIGRCAPLDARVANRADRG